jgi:pSer/pThr/pTyr-binding forkhead associated (FHA) protein
MITCDRCKTENLDGSQYCDECGAPLRPNGRPSPNPVRPAPHARLVIEKGRSSGKQFMLSDVEAQIGRWDADGGIFPDVDLDTDDPEAKVSRRHARITLSNGQYFLEDLGSTNGTFINRGKRLPPGQRQALCDGDEIIVGKTFLRFHIVK